MGSCDSISGSISGLGADLLGAVAGLLAIGSLSAAATGSGLHSGSGLNLGFGLS